MLGKYEICDLDTYRITDKIHTDKTHNNVITLML